MTVEAWPRSQTLTSQYGQTELNVDTEIPTNALRWKLAQMHVSTPDAEIVALVRERAETGGYTDRQTSQTIEAALWIMNEMRREYRWVMGGMPPA